MSIRAVVTRRRTSSLLVLPPILRSGGPENAGESMTQRKLIFYETLDVRCRLIGVGGEISTLAFDILERGGIDGPT